MTQVNFAADEVAIIGTLPVRQQLVTLTATGQTLWRMRSQQPLAEASWHTVYERIAQPPVGAIEQVLGNRQLGVDFDYLTAEGALLVFSTEAIPTV